VLSYALVDCFRDDRSRREKSADAQNRHQPRLRQGASGTSRRRPYHRQSHHPAAHEIWPLPPGGRPTRHPRHFRNETLENAALRHHRSARSCAYAGEKIAAFVRIILETTELADVSIIATWSGSPITLGFHNLLTWRPLTVCGNRHTMFLQFIHAIRQAKEIP
jgi:hypothetical protein